MELQRQFAEIAELIQDARNKALTVINRGLIDLYWKIGEYISRKIQDDSWGKSIVQSLSDFLRDFYPDLKGFSAQNMWRMKQFYECYKDQSKLSTLLREISWSNNLHILSKTKSLDEKEFYIRLCIKEKYSARELERQIDSGFFERYMLTEGKAPTAITNLYP